VTTELEGLAAGRALDLACGAGRHAVWLAERGWQVTGVDFSEAALRQARSRAAERGVEVRWVQADLLEYEPPDGAFDLVLVLYLHVPRKERRLVLAKASAAVAECGRLLLVGHDLANLDTGAPGPTDPGLLYTSGEVAAELPDLHIERAARVSRLTETDCGEVEALDALVLARR
jgi:ubiquinone/menaquinone biosynthesis C-methylase UbiE